ncbi:hypothetical protein QBC46DRAFT_445733 [Diplogelasinospora grovesii]|uniref:Uncharacterized protein n=1 Tax=Diplogelasinospora grovesii TaxID=303347 RepID=A0AAN6NFI5_9PEZI|nr:hypothetical protein QBC46DRAFT_445733 [Diplogelasinospora grovesii]
MHSSALNNRSLAGPSGNSPLIARVEGTGNRLMQCWTGNHDCYCSIGMSFEEEDTMDGSGIQTHARHLQDPGAVAPLPLSHATAPFQVLLHDASFAGRHGRLLLVDRCLHTTTGAQLSLSWCVSSWEKARLRLRHRPKGQLLKRVHGGAWSGPINGTWLYRVLRCFNVFSYYFTGEPAVLGGTVDVFVGRIKEGPTERGAGKPTGGVIGCSGDVVLPLRAISELPHARMPARKIEQGKKVKVSNLFSSSKIWQLSKLDTERVPTTTIEKMADLVFREISTLATIMRPRTELCASVLSVQGAVGPLLIDNSMRTACVCVMRVSVPSSAASDANIGRRPPQILTG